MATTRICSIPGCNKPHDSHGFCGMHMCRLRKYGDPLGRPAIKAKRICKVDGCANKHDSNGYCGMHANRVRRYGNHETVHPRRKVPRARNFYVNIVRQYDGDECLLWPFAKSPAGYGVVRMEDGVQRIASRLLCEEMFGPPPTPDHEAAHSCGRGSDGCVTKRHLSWKTHVENEADKITHGTRLRGEGVGNSKLTEKDVHKIRGMTRGISQRQIGIKFGVTQSAVSAIQRRKIWAWLD